ncbi:MULTISPECIES: hypothetical protein [unclassified Photobacterium]|uniref:hypothetical protein n=1 Tax=unclassified Photobacterium TaxID=2628852 RepID=UPI000D17D96E|nr:MULTISPECIES: hypothetical protein [unclassified Photobacterium]PSV21139.1 hypothetical protein C9J42_20975 [Photobacterium sp. GB-56]PSV37405.1 hypothetical protein C9J46_21040 [Photobacterium sp. GB-36]PSV40248.1 hypothetical protein C9J38_07000 [Photobacterium sp. GB-210]PSV50294.1 hypothetical protein C9J45_20755 [Photobacterium sp. GB-1]PSW73674.1 hypothetical protein C9J41_10720 [Photobacterium sp. GB-50]
MKHNPYNSQHIPPQAPGNQQGFWSQMARKGVHFPFTCNNHHVSSKVLRSRKPSELRTLDPSEGGYNERQIRDITLPWWGLVYFYAVTFAKVIALYMMPLAFVLLGIIYLVTNISSQSSIDILIFLLYILIPSLLIWWSFSFFNGKLPIKTLFSLSRETGMVTLYGFGNKVRFSHPFVEFDCYLTTSPTPQGFINYQLFLVHRYNGYKHGVPIGRFINGSRDLDEYKRLWNMIQAYMDVSQPLPDIPMNEPFRHKDNATVAYDKAHHRKPDFWFSMNDEAFEQAVTKIVEKQNSEPPLGEVIPIPTTDSIATTPNTASA